MFYYEGQFYEGNSISLNINDSTWLYGATVFTTMRVYKQSLNHPLTNWQKHCDRLLKSIEELNWTFPDWQLIKQEVEQLLIYFPVIRITVFPDGRELIIGRQLPTNLFQKQQEGIKGLVCLNPSIQRSIPEHKTGNYLAPWLALQQAQKQGYQEAILTNIEHNWLETSTGNLWGYKQGIWFTPNLAQGILPGIARQTIIDKAQFPIEINQWTPDFINDLEAIAYSNSVIEIIPFNKIINGEKVIDYDHNHPAYKALKGIFD
ncbi:aminotransferase class IV [Cyanobacterium aponinum]|uniref:4-amino-4-deoxychorismate lyase n=1 Tax=Cyanobacterium aponinum 0216 TaxID=2676140 RepID=A0A844GZS7_9CHRO|nr:aminotransferase class IV [Cyanobacterium aponinum]MTF40289.1 4-amino-4-deoxychorismate lyase [Cyanobacterium aponinum 0216]